MTSPPAKPAVAVDAPASSPGAARGVGRGMGSGMGSAGPARRAESTGRWLGTMCILGSLFGWSSIPLFLRYFTELVDGWTANGWRYAVSAVL